VTGPPRADRGGGGGLTFAVAVASVAAFGLVGGLPWLLGPVIGAAGMVAASFVRRRADVGSTLGPLPALLALAALAVTSPPVASAELFGGLATLGVLLWLADDPARPAGGGRRAGMALGSCAFAVAVAWSIILLLPRPSSAIGAAGALLVVVLLALAYLLGHETRPRPVPEASV
jgi:hypothetical protein